MTVEQVKKILDKVDVNGQCIEGRIGDCEIKVGKKSLSIAGFTYYI